MSTVRLDVVAGGWDLPGWEHEFYPEDLPNDWRLTYFANEFPSVMVAATHWLRADEAQLAAWSEDVPDGFRFYLEDGGPMENGGPTAGRHGLDLARRVLGSKLAGLVQEADAAGSIASGAVACFRVPGEPGGVPGSDCLPAWRVSRAHVRDLRAARAWLEGLCPQAPSGRGLLLLAGAEVGAEDLRRWWHLLRLLGLA